MKNFKIKRNVWNLKLLFDGDNDPKIKRKRKIVERESYKFINKWKNRKDYLENPIALKKALNEYEKWRRIYGDDGNEGYYFHLRTFQDKNNPELKAKFNQIQNFGKKIQNDIQFFELRLAKVPLKTQKEFLKSKHLKNYKHFLSRLFAEAKYLLSEPEEKILNLKSPTSYLNWVNMTSGFLSKEEREIVSKEGKKEIKNFSEILSLLDNQDKIVRDSAALAFNDILDKHVGAAEAEMNSILADKKTNDELRGFSRPDLPRHISDDIESEVVDALVDSVSSRFNIARRFYKLKATLMGVKKLKYHERNVPYGKIDKKYSFNDAANIVYKVFKNLDKEFSDIFLRFIDNGQIDVYPKKGKRNGAFCFHNLISQPTYILLNYTDRLHDVITLAHELGHSINNEMIKENQNALNFGTSTATAEAASVFMEDFILEEISKIADDKLKLAIMMMRLNDNVSTLFRQIALYKFERELHDSFRIKEYLSKEEIGGLFQKHMSAYMGTGVELSIGSENWWVYWGHIRWFFYVYSYASGCLISKFLQTSVKKDPAFIEKVKELFSAGRSDSPKNIFRKLGVDITGKKFWDTGIDEVENLLGETAALAKKLGKI